MYQGSMKFLECDDKHAKLQRYSKFKPFQIFLYFILQNFHITHKNCDSATIQSMSAFVV